MRCVLCVINSRDRVTIGVTVSEIQLQVLYDTPTQQLQL